MGCSGTWRFRTGVTLAVMLIASPLARAQTDGSPKWAGPFTTLNTSTVGNIVSSPAIGTDGMVYIGVQIGLSSALNPSGILFAIDPSNGAEKWRFTAPDWIDSTPAVAQDGTVYFGCWDGKLYALQPTDGAKKWELTIGSFVASSPALAADGTIYVGAASNLVAVTPDGVLKWSFPAEDWIDSSPAIGPDGTIYVGSWDNRVYAVRPDGTEKWRYETGDNVIASPAVGADGTIYIGSRDVSLYALAPDGTLRWRFVAGDTIEASPVLGLDGTIYVPTTGGRLIALNPDGTEKWRFPRANEAALNALYSTPAVRADGTIIFGTSNNALYALRPDGTQLWRNTLADWSDSSALVTADGIYIGCSDKRLYAFHSTGGTAMTDWPQFRRNPFRNGWQPIGSTAGTNGRLMNLSVRTFAGADASTLIVGFVIGGSGTRSVLVRGVGPTLQQFGVPGFLADPQIRVFEESTAVAENDQWSLAPNKDAIVSTAPALGAFPLPADSADAAVLRDFRVGDNSVHVSGAAGTTGIALVEAYDAGGGATARLKNVSARSAVTPGAGSLVAGFVVGESTRSLLVRGVGPKLMDFGLSGVLTNPQLRIYRGTYLIAENDDWAVPGNRAAIEGTAQQLSTFPLTDGSHDAALLLTLPPGAYSAEVVGAGAGTGVALVEVYELP